MRRSLLALLGLAGCAATPAPPPDLPPPPAPLAPVPTKDDAPARAEDRDPDAAPGGGNLPPRPRPTGDRERDTLALGFWGCRIMARRLTPRATGKAVVRVELDTEGDVVGVSVWSEGLAQPVLDCVTRAVRATRFDPPHGSAELAVPFDLAGADDAAPAAAPAPAGNISL